MEESVQAFLIKINKQKHVLELIKNLENLSIILIAENLIVAFTITNKELYILENENEAVNICEISGKTKDLQDLLSGEEPLRVLLRQGKIRVSTSFRILLLLESLFYLTKSDAHLVKT
jgi:hypothetical protein